MENNFFSKLLQLPYLNRWLIFISDLFLSVSSTVISFLVIDLILMATSSIRFMAPVLFASTLCSAISFLFFQTYKGVIRHSTFVEAGRIGLASLLKAAGLFPAAFFFPETPDTPYLFVAAIIDVSITFFMLIFLRVVLISIYNQMVDGVNNRTERDRLLILDSGPRSVSLIGSSLAAIERNYRIAGFLNMDHTHALRMGKYRTYGIKKQEEFDRLTVRLNVKAVLFPDYKSVKKEQEQLIRFCEKRKVRMLILPSIDEWRENNKYLPEVRIEDLLNREEIRINLAEIVSHLQNKVILVTGAAGSIGGELSRQVCRLGAKQLILIDNAETPLHNIRLELEEKFPEIKFHFIIGDVRIRERMENLFARFYPQVVFHAAAYKHVPLMEENPCEAVLSNVGGTVNIADLSVKYGVEQFVMISTDKAVNPANVMGASKRMAEIYIQSLGLSISQGRKEGITRFTTTRFGNVLGSNGSVIPRFREQLRKGGPLTVTHPDIIRYFMTIPEACSLVLEAASIGEGNEIFIFDMGEPVKIADLARRMIELAGMEPGKDIQIAYTGLRPGEKLYEELLATKENALPTSNPKICKARVREYDYADVLPQILALCETARNVDVTETVRQLKTAIPEFRSKQSSYEYLDAETGYRILKKR
ncbi:MAG: polysaccharide biosynthesis protein [Tannerellaceae bacterium]|nr:polysaccharide biosynthesis protein [Tannerellaceae bacterium]